MRTLAVAFAFCVALGAQSADDLERLFQAHEWFELRSAVTDRSPSLMRAAVATAFNDPETAERLLREVIRSAPASNAADEAYGMLSQIYLRSGQYRRWQTSYRQWIAAIPGSARARAEEEDQKKLAGRPDQVNGRPRHAVLRHDPGDITIPVSVDGKVDDFLFDTGAWTSVMTERMAARLGVKLDATRRTISGSSGQSTGFRTAIVKEVDIGGTHFRNVSFAVIEGTGPLGDADAGIVGMPILLALGVIRWSPDGTVEIGSSAPRVQAAANLVFDRNRLLLRTRVLGRDVLTTLDTGAITTDLNANFATTFPQAVQGAKKGTTDITGVGGTQTFDSLEIPEVSFGIGPAEVLLRPATVTLQRIGNIGGDCCVGNAGQDLLKQGFTIDFSSMTLRLAQTPPEGPRFEASVVSVNNSAEPRVAGGFQPGGRYSVTNYPLRALIAAAYLRPQVNPDFLIAGGPDWIDTARFNVEAKAAEEFPAGPDGPTAPRRVMLQNLLAERFGLKVHHETRQGQVFVLQRAKSNGALGPKLRPSQIECGNAAASAPGTCVPRLAPGSLTLPGTALTALVNLLPRFVDRVVVDGTGLAGRFDIELTWTPGPTEWVAPPSAAGVPSKDDGSSLVTALREQLGLRLQSQVAPIDVLVIDAATRPTEN